MSTEHDSKQERKMLVSLVNDIHKAKCDSELKEKVDKVFEKMNNLSNFNSDHYKILSFSIFLANYQKQAYASKRQFIVNGILIIINITVAIMVGYFTIK